MKFFSIYFTQICNEKHIRQHKDTLMRKDGGNVIIKVLITVSHVHPEILHRFANET